MQKLESIISYLVEGKTRQAISSILSLIKVLNQGKEHIDLNEIQNEVVLISSTFESLNKSNNLGLESKADHDIQKNKIVVSILSVINDLKKYLTKYEKTEIDRIDIGVFQKAQANKKMDEICDWVEKARSIRVIGSNRQEKFEKEPLNCIKNYYEAIQKRCSHDFDGKHPLVYRRITNRNLTKKYHLHLRECFQETEKNKNNFKVIFYGELHLIFTYLIIDTIYNESILILNLYTEDNDIEIFDTSVVYFTKDVAIIDQFKSHFKCAWSKEKDVNLVIKNIKEFNFSTPFDKKIDHGIKNILKYAKRIPKNSVRYDHLRYHTREFEHRLKGIVESQLTVPHTDRNQRISTAYYWYLKNLSKGCSYKTISVLEFWEGRHNFKRFLDLHREAFERVDNRGLVTRIYIIDDEKINSPEYIKRQKKIVHLNFELAKEFSENYQYVVLFVENYLSFLSTNRNFAIWSKDNNYRVVFLSEYPSNFVRKGKTNIYFLEEWNTEHPKYFNNRTKYIKASGTINKWLKESFNQKEKLGLVYNNSKCKESKKMDEAEIKKYQDRIKFLQACDVSVERYFY